MSKSRITSRKPIEDFVVGKLLVSASRFRRKRIGVGRQREWRTLWTSRPEVATSEFSADYELPLAPLQLGFVWTGW